MIKDHPPSTPLLSYYDNSELQENNKSTGVAIHDDCDNSQPSLVSEVNLVFNCCYFLLFNFFFVNNFSHHEFIL